MAKQGFGVAVFRRSRSAVILICLAGSACTLTTDGRNPGTLAVRMPGTLPAATPPETPPETPPAPPPSGIFAGVATLTSSAGSRCRQQMPVSHFVVTGNRVRYQGFRGTIQPDNFVQMQGGGGFIYGYFDGGRFTGHFWQPPPRCTYDLVLDHVG